MGGDEDEAVPWPGFDKNVAEAMAGRKTVGAIVYELVRSAILSGALQPGQRLKQEELANAFGVSRIPVRTALMQLQSEELVAFHPRRGAVVSGQSAAQVREIYEIRELLETHALSKSMRTMSEDRIQRLRELADRLDEEREGKDFVELRVRFYQELYDSTRNPELVKIIENLRSVVRRNLLARRVSPPDSDAAHGQHRALVEVVAAGNVRAAKSWLRNHLGAVRAGVEAIAATAGDVEK